jgi:hypothetical protein
MVIELKQKFEITVDDIELRTSLIEALLRDYFAKMQYPVKVIKVKRLSPTVFFKDD